MADGKNAYGSSSNVNRGLAQRRRIQCLTPNVPYLITKTAPMAIHKEYGQGYQIHLRDKEKKVFFVILPSRIVTQIGVASFDQYNADVENRKPPFLIFKGMDGSAFDIAIKPFSVEMAKLAVNGQVYVEPVVEEPPLDSSLDWLDDLTAAGPSEAPDKLPEKDSSIDLDNEDENENVPPTKKVKVEEK